MAAMVSAESRTRGSNGSILLRRWHPPGDRLRLLLLIALPSSKHKLSAHNYIRLRQNLGREKGQCEGNP